MSPSRRRAAAGLLPAIAWFAATAAVALGSSRSPTRLELERAWQPPSLALPFGAGEGGVDLLAAAGHATVRSLVLAAGVSLIGFAIGTPLGAWAGFRGSLWERAVGRACDLVQAFPTFLLALTLLAAVRAPTRWHLGLVFSAGAWAPFARMALLQARVLAASPFLEAARALGAGRARIVLRHVLPNLLGPVAIQAGSAAAAVVLGEASLSFVGLGPRDGPSLGALLEQGVLVMLRAPHVLGVAAAAVVLTSGTLQLASESLRAAWIADE
ncbi:MAG: ABC transporter permease subunit [Polyangiaceae bacterium]|nr:ABC transporter permease subunit [Polyangiaceae bacterium]